MLNGCARIAGKRDSSETREATHELLPLYRPHQTFREMRGCRRSVKKSRSTRQRLHVRRRQLAQYKASLRKKRKRRASRPGLPTRRRHGRRLASISLPSDFRFRRNPEEIIEFLNEIEPGLRVRNRSIKLVLRDVKELGADAVLVLLSRMKDFGFLRGVGIQGDEPADPALRAVLESCGFFEHVLRTGSRSRSTTRGAIRHKASVAVVPSVARELKDFATTQLLGDKLRWPAVYRTLIECMSNTKGHAGRNEKWSASVWVDADRRVAQFAVADNGRGILRTLKIRGVQKLLLHIGITENTDIFKALLEGKIESQTGLHYRGKGLPEMYHDMQRGGIENLMIAVKRCCCRRKHEVVPENASVVFRDLCFVGERMLRWAKSDLDSVSRWTSARLPALDISKRVPSRVNYSVTPSSSLAFSRRKRRRKYSLLISTGSRVTRHHFLRSRSQGLAREFGPEVVLATISVISTEEPYLREQVHQYIREGASLPSKKQRLGDEA